MQVLAFIFVLLFSTPLFSQTPTVTFEGGPFDSRLELFTDGTAEITLPGWQQAIGFNACVAEFEVVGSTQVGCIIPDGDIPAGGEPSIWVYFVGEAAEIHLPLIGAVFQTGNKADLLRFNRPRCAIDYADAHHNNMLQQID